MRKRNVRGICAFLCTILLGCLIPAGEVQAQRALDVARERGYQLEERYQPAGSIITEINTGQILWQENAQKQWPPASMTKLMTILLAYEEIKAGNLELESTAEVNERYTDIAGRYALSNNKMQPGASYTVAELMDLIIVPSSAAATYMLADMVESDPDRFVERMNQKAQELGIRDCVNVSSDIGPFLIINGEAQDVDGVGGGLNPRTAIGQRADGAILLLVVDGRQVTSLGASFSDLQDIMLQYGAVNASAMDGGTSTQMYYNGEVINKPYSPTGPRTLPTAFLIK